MKAAWPPKSSRPSGRARIPSSSISASWSNKTMSQRRQSRIQAYLSRISRWRSSELSCSHHTLPAVQWLLRLTCRSSRWRETQKRLAVHRRNPISCSHWQWNHTLIHVSRKEKTRINLTYNCHQATTHQTQINQHKLILSSSSKFDHTTSNRMHLSITVPQALKLSALMTVSLINKKFN